MYEEWLPTIWGNAQIFSDIRGGRSLQMKDRWESNTNVWFPFMYSQKWNCYFQNRIIMFCLPVPTLIHLWEIYIYFQDRSAHSSAGKYVDRSWEYINRSQTRVSPFRLKIFFAYKRNKANLDPFHMCFTISLLKFTSLFSLLFAYFNFKFCASLHLSNFRFEASEAKFKYIFSFFSLFFIFFRFFSLFLAFFSSLFYFFSLNFRFSLIFSLNFRLFYLRFRFRFLVFRIEVNHVKSGFCFASKRNEILASISNFASEVKVWAHPISDTSMWKLGLWSRNSQKRNT